MHLDLAHVSRYVHLNGKQLFAASLAPRTLRSAQPALFGFSGKRFRLIVSHLFSSFFGHSLYFSMVGVVDLAVFSQLIQSPRESYIPPNVGSTPGCLLDVQQSKAEGFVPFAATPVPYKRSTFSGLCCL